MPWGLPLGPFTFFEFVFLKAYYLNDQLFSLLSSGYKVASLTNECRNNSGKERRGGQTLEIISLSTLLSQRHEDRHSSLRCAQHHRIH